MTFPPEPLVQIQNNFTELFLIIMIGQLVSEIFMSESVNGRTRGRTRDRVPPGLIQGLPVLF